MDPPARQPSPTYPVLDHHRHHHGEQQVYAGPCPLPSQDDEGYFLGNSDAPTVTPDQLIYVRVSGTDIRPKEVILVSLALLLLVFSIALFFKHWRKNYWDINQLPYYAYLYKTDEPVLLQSQGASLEAAGIPLDEMCVAQTIDAVSPSQSLLARGQGGSCQSSLRLDRHGFSRESRSSLRLDSKPPSFSSRRTSSTRKNRSSFVHVTAEAMHKLSLNKMNSASITGFHHQTHIRNQNFHSPPWGSLTAAGEPRLRRCQSGVDRRSRMHSGTTGLAGGHRWTTTRRKYRKTSLTDVTGLESGEQDDPVRLNSIALREMRQKTSSSKSDEVVIENDEDEINNDDLLKVVVALPTNTNNTSILRSGNAINPVFPLASNSTDRQHKCIEEGVTFSEQPLQEPKRTMLRIKEAII